MPTTPMPASPFWSSPAAAGLIAGLFGASLNQFLALLADRFKARSAQQARREEIRFEKFHDRLLIHSD